MNDQHAGIILGNQMDHMNDMVDHAAMGHHMPNPTPVVDHAAMGHDMSNMVSSTTPTPIDHAAMGHTMQMKSDSPVDHAAMGHDMSGMDMSNMDHGSGHSMPMYFYFGNMRGEILFKSWKPETSSGLVGACFVVFAMTVFYFFLQFLKRCLTNRYPTSNLSMIKRILYVPHWATAVLVAVTMLLSYMIMLVSMTFNGWLFLSIGLGAFFGYLMFGFNDGADQVDGCCN